jgi:hypothetical protein
LPPIASAPVRDLPIAPEAGGLRPSEQLWPKRPAAKATGIAQIATRTLPARDSGKFRTG